MTIALPEIASCQKGEMPTTGKRVLDDPEEQRTQNGAQHGPGPARDGDAADHAGRDHLQFESAGDIDIGHGIARHPQVSRQPRQGAPK